MGFLQPRNLNMRDQALPLACLRLFSLTQIFPNKKRETIYFWFFRTSVRTTVGSLIAKVGASASPKRVPSHNSKANRGSTTSNTVRIIRAALSCASIYRSPNAGPNIQTLVLCENLDRPVPAVPFCNPSKRVVLMKREDTKPSARQFSARALVPRGRIDITSGDRCIKIRRRYFVKAVSADGQYQRLTEKRRGVSFRGAVAGPLTPEQAKVMMPHIPPKCFNCEIVAASQKLNF